MNEDTTSRARDDGSARPAQTDWHSDSAADPVADLKNVVADATTEIRDSAADAAEMARDKAEEVAEQGKAAGADRMEGFARAARRAADDLEEESPEIARYVRQAADGLNNAATSVRGRSVGEIMDMVEDFARRQPTAYFGSTVLAGFMLSRFVKSRPARMRRQGGAQRDTGMSAASRGSKPAQPATRMRTGDDRTSMPSGIEEMTR